MAKQPVDVGVRFTGDASGFQKAAAQVKGSVQGMKKEIKSTAGVFDELGDAIGGMGGEISSSISSIATAASGIGAMVVVVGLLAKAWKTSQENIDLYLKSADKLKSGAAGFTVDVETARVDVRKRAQGQIALGYKIEQENLAKLTKFAVLYNDEEKKHFAQLVMEGRQMQENGRKLRDSVIGIHDKTEFQIKYNSLLQEQERLNDEELARKTEFEQLEAELIRQRTIIQDKDSKIKDKADAILNAEIIANKLLKEKNAFIDRQLTNITALADITATEEVVEGKIAELQKQKATNLKEYGSDMLKVLKMETKISKEIEKQALIRQSGISKVGTRDSSHAIIAGLVRGETSKSGLTPGEGMSEMTSGLGMAQTAVEELSSSFESLFLNVGGGFRGMVNSMLDSLKLLFAQLIGKAALFGLLQMLFPASNLAVASLSGLRRFIGIPGFASGTNFAPGGLAMVGERGPELVNLPRGSQVMPMNKQKMQIEVVGKVSGRDLAIVLSRYQSERLTNT